MDALLIFWKVFDKLVEIEQFNSCVHHLHPHELGRVRCTHLGVRNPEANVQGTPCVSFGQFKGFNLDFLHDSLDDRVLLFG